MGRLRVDNFSLSLDGYGAGPRQSLEDPVGVGGRRLHDWLFATRTMRERFGMDGGDVGLDDVFAQRGELGVGATIMGRNMFGPVRGAWGDEGWTGWWGDEPPFHHPVFVLTHHDREPVTMTGGTTFHFVTGGIREALDLAVEAAGGADVRVGGGVSTLRQFLRAALIDDLHLVIVPVLLGQGERLLTDLGDSPARYERAELVGSPSVAHIRLVRRPAPARAHDDQGGTAAR